MSHIFTTPAISLEMAMPSLACRVTDLIEAGVDGVVIASVTTGAGDKAPTCQSLTDRSSDAEMREEENAREIMVLCPTKVSMG